MRLAFAGCVFDSGTREVTGRGGRVVPISPKAFQLLEALILARPKAVSKDDLHALLWPETFVADANLPNLVGELRAQLGDDAKSPQIIRTVQRFGYAFVAAAGPAPAIEPAIEVVPPTKRFPVRAVFGAAILLALLVAAGFLSLRRFGLTSKRAGIPFNARDWVLVARFENRTGQPLLDGTLEYALANELSRSRYVNVAPRERIGDALRLMRRPPDTPVDAMIGREICLRDGEIRALVTGRIEKFGSKYVLNVELVDPNQGTAIASTVENAAAEEQLLPAARRISDEVRAWLGEEPRSIQERGKRLAKVTTRSLKALQLYSRADAVIAGENDPVAEELLRQAVAEDPEFASAYIHLAHAIHNQNRPKAEFLPPAETAFRLSETTTERERYFIRGSYYQLLGQDEKAITSYQTLLTLYPDHYWGIGNLAYCYEKQGRVKNGLEMRARRADLRPKDFRSNAEAAFSLALFDPVRSSIYVRRARELVTPAILEEDPGGVSWLELVPAEENWLAGNIPEALRIADGVAAKIDSLGDKAREDYADNLFGVYLELGRIDSAEGCLQKISDPVFRHEKMSRVSFMREDPDALKRDLESSREGAWQRIPKIRLCLLARAGLLSEADRLLTQFEQCCSGEPYVRILRGEVAFARGQNDEAISELEEGTSHNADSFPFFFTGSESLARALRKKGDLGRAIDVLERASARRRQAAFYQAGQYWVWIRYRLAQLYREAGRENEARTIEEELRKLLSLADPTHPIRRGLERLRGF